MSIRDEHFDVIVIGAGAAGMMCAWRAGLRGRRVLLLDHADQPGKKILISGGGRCNFTNLQAAPDRFLSANRHFMKSALSRYTQHDFIQLVERHKIAYHEKTLGQLFCDGSARAIVAMLLDECRTAGVELRTGYRVREVEKSDRFRVKSDQGDVTAASVVLATGGLSIPKMGATGFALSVARRFGLPVTETRPALVPLTFDGGELELMQSLSGVSLEVQASSGSARFREAMLFTHRGLSGPAVLQASSYWREGQPVVLNLLPDLDATAFLRERRRTRGAAQPRTILADLLPQRLSHRLAETHMAPQPMGGQTERDLVRLATTLNAWQVMPSGSEGYAKAEVMAGGVDTAALSSKTMEARHVPGLFVIGEAVDVTGWLGGYNFQWAWSSGWVAGEVA